VYVDGVAGFRVGLLDRKALEPHAAIHLRRVNDLALREHMHFRKAITWMQWWGLA
jgi:hypothetical protein